MDEIIKLSQRVIDEVTIPEKVEDAALAFQRINESVQKLNDILVAIKNHSHNKLILVDENGLDWWQKEQFDFHSRFFEKLYSTISSLQFVFSFYFELKDYRGKKNSNTKFLKNLRSINIKKKNFLSSLDVLEEARKFRSDYFVHPMNIGSVEWMTIGNRVYFLRNRRDDEMKSTKLFGKELITIPSESKILQSLLEILSCIYSHLLMGL